MPIAILRQGLRAGPDCELHAVEFEGYSGALGRHVRLVGQEDVELGGLYGREAVVAMRRERRPHWAIGRILLHIASLNRKQAPEEILLSGA